MAQAEGPRTGAEQYGNGHLWREEPCGPESFKSVWYCIKKGCRARVTRIGRPPNGICPGGDPIKEMISPKYHVAA